MTKSARTTTATLPRQGGVVVWFTGLSGAGKSTIANAVSDDLRADGRSVVVLDGDVVRARVSRDLGFSRADRDANVARIAELARQSVEDGSFVLVAAVSPYRDARDAARRTVERFLEVHVSTPLAACIARDVKGLYAKALAGEIERFTGVSDPYEAPEQPELTLDTTNIDLAAAVARVRTTLAARGWLDGPRDASATEIPT